MNVNGLQIQQFDAQKYYKIFPKTFSLQKNIITFAVQLPKILFILDYTTMGVTQVKRKLRKLRKKSDLRRQGLKLLTAKPVIKKVDAEELKKQFTTVA